MNLGLQCVGMMRSKMSDEHEATISYRNNMSQLRQAAEKKPDLIPAVLDSIAPVKILLTDVLQRLGLHGEKFQVFPAACADNMKELWSALECVDSTLKYGDKFRKADLEDHKALVDFMNHCCQSRHYSFTVKKCGQVSCSMCKPVRMPSELFDQIHPST